jgi:ABC-type amino acid transport substrate-binding protein
VSRDYPACVLWYASQNADIAAGPILVTDDRRQVVDFTMPFMTLQATLLLRRPAAGTELKVKDLADLVGQSEIKYGTLRRGVIPRSFRQTNNSLLTMVWRNMRRLVVPEF